MYMFVELGCISTDIIFTVLKYCRINKKREKSTLSASIQVIFYCTFRYAGRKRCSIFCQIFNRMFLLCFSGIRWNFGIILVLFNGGVLLLVEWT